MIRKMALKMKDFEAHPNERRCGKMKCLKKKQAKKDYSVIIFRKSILWFFEVYRKPNQRHSHFKE